MPASRKMGARVLAVLLCALPALAGEERFSLSLSYGAARISPRDFNEFLGDFVRWRRDIGYALPDAGLKTLDWADGFEASVSVPLGDRVSAFASVGRIGTKRNGNDIDAGVYNGTYTYKRNDAIRATVARLGLSYAVPLSDVVTLRPHASLDGYWTAFHDDGAEISMWTDQAPSTDLAWTADAMAFNLGWTLGASLDVALGSRLSLSVDAGWRSAKTAGFVGTYQETDYNVAAPPAPFRLFSYHDYVDWIPATYRELNLPGSYAQGVVRGLRDAAIDLSGVYAAAGLRIVF